MNLIILIKHKNKINLSPIITTKIKIIIIDLLTNIIILKLNNNRIISQAINIKMLRIHIIKTNFLLIIQININKI
jgi:hypothetical protein